MATPPTRSPRIAVVTVSFDSDAVLPALLGSLATASAEPLTVLVADNKPGEPSPVRTTCEAHGAHYLPMTGNLGYGGAVNAAAATLSPDIEWILVANPDLVFSPGSIDTLLALAETDARSGSVGPATLNSDGSLYPSARAVPSLRTGVGHALFANLWVGNPWSRAYRNDTDTTPVRRDAGWLSGSCVLVRREAFEMLGGFDDGYFMYFEDVDLGYRLGRLGYRNVYEPAAVVSHSGAHSTDANAAAMIDAHHDSARRFLAKKYSGPLLWPVRVVLTVGLRMRSALIRRRLRRG